MYSNKLAEKPQLVVLNKLDVEGASDLADRFCQALGHGHALRMSAATHQGLEAVKTAMLQTLERLDDRP
jgi:GTP-binding protein